MGNGLASLSGLRITTVRDVLRTPRGTSKQHFQITRTANNDFCATHPEGIDHMRPSHIH